MKYLILSISLVFSFNSLAQDPDPDLFQTWNLNYLHATDLNDIFEISDINPTINPTLTISQDFIFSAEGACNSFEGSYTFMPTFLFVNIDFSSSTDDCNFTDHISFEDDYFEFLGTEFWYEIMPDDNGLVLTLSNALMGEAIFRNYILSVPDFNINQIEVYHNPNDSVIYISDRNTIINKILIYDSNGRIIKIADSNFKFLDITEFSAGIYLMKIITENGTLNKRIIKN